jgi:hypothetical protein
MTSGFHGAIRLDNGGLVYRQAVGNACAECVGSDGAVAILSGIAARELRTVMAFAVET